MEHLDNRTFAYYSIQIMEINRSFVISNVLYFFIFNSCKICPNAHITGKDMNFL